jgi:hypothetical protein
VSAATVFLTVVDRPQIDDLLEVAPVAFDLAAWNQDPKPFVWTKTADDILDSLAAYCGRINDSGH